MSTPREMHAVVPQGSVLFPTLYSVYINNTFQTPSVYLDRLADDIRMHATDRKEGYILRKLQRGLSSIETCCKRWNSKSIRIKLGPSTSLIELDHLRFISHWKAGASPLWIM
jgi:hypothetical protein